jgi:hypothetical protein
MKASHCPDATDWSSHTQRLKRNLRWENKLCEKERTFRIVPTEWMSWHETRLCYITEKFHFQISETRSHILIWLIVAYLQVKVKLHLWLCTRPRRIATRRYTYSNSPPLFFKRMFAGTLMQSISQGRNIQCTSRCATSDKSAGAHQLFGGVLTGWINPAYSTHRRKMKPDGILSALMFLPPRWESWYWTWCWVEPRVEDEITSPTGNKTMAHQLLHYNQVHSTAPMFPNTLLPFTHAPISYKELG